jgi:hypothetical protein
MCRIDLALKVRLQIKGLRELVFVSLTAENERGRVYAERRYLYVNSLISCSPG